MKEKPPVFGGKQIQCGSDGCNAAIGNKLQIRFANYDGQLILTILSPPLSIYFDIYIYAGVWASAKVEEARFVNWLRSMGMASDLTAGWKINDMYVVIDCKTNLSKVVKLLCCIWSMNPIIC